MRRDIPDRFAAFPSFRTIFEKGRNVPYYLELLSLSSAKDIIKDAVAAIRVAVNSSPNLDREIESLLAEKDWRPHLAAAVGLLVGPASTTSVSVLWDAFDRGSWVTPQLAVVAFKRDPCFAENAARRLVAGCPVGRAQLDGLSGLERHVLAGPAGIGARSAKALNALSFLYRQLPNPGNEVLALLDSAEVQEFLKSDVDRGDRLAQEWLGAVETDILR